MRSILIVVLAGIVVFSLVSSCATVPTGPLSPGELRLLNIEVAGTQTVRLGTQYAIYINFEADSKPEMKRVCFLYDQDGPYCVRNMEVRAGTIKVWLLATIFGSYRLKCYVEYMRDGKTWASNAVDTPVNAVY